MKLRSKNTTTYLGFSKTIQGLGIMFSTDNPTIYLKSPIAFEIRLLYFKFWIVYEFK